jgi:hypothetical protein
VIHFLTKSYQTTLINYLKHNHPEFKHVLPYTTEPREWKDEIVDVDYKLAGEGMFTTEEHDWFILQKSKGKTNFWLH